MLAQNANGHTLMKEQVLVRSPKLCISRCGQFLGGWPSGTLRAVGMAFERQCYSHPRPISFHTLPKLIWCGSWGCNLGQWLRNHGPHVFYRQKIRRASRPGKQFNLVIDEEPLDNACHVWSSIILLKYGLWPSPEGKE
ncbi:uncharacterized protein TNCV_3461461 [Trichonephila clavipes]|nr:uncharacterized protein TNCV_3461461 [Trichonephila clavipes]